MLATTVTVPDWLLPGLILLIIGAVLTWVTRVTFRAFRNQVEDWFGHLMEEVKPNGGNTNKLGDLVVKQGETLVRVEAGVSGLYPRVEAIETEQAKVRDELTVRAISVDAVTAHSVQTDELKVASSE